MKKSQEKYTVFYQNLQENISSIYDQKKLMKVYEVCIPYKAEDRVSEFDLRIIVQKIEVSTLEEN